MLNNCDFQGRFAADPELRTTQTGKQVASFRMAVDRDMVDANGHRPTDWLTFTAWGKTAEFVSKYFRKGSAAVVHSRCQTRQYEDKNGNNRTAVEVVANNISFAGSKSSNAGRWSKLSESFCSRLPERSPCPSGCCGGSSQLFCRQCR